MKKFTLVLFFMPVLLFALEKKTQFQWLNAIYASGGLETKMVLSYSERYPFLQGEGVLTKNNSFTWRVFGEISPVSFNAGGEVSLTPLAILVLQWGAKVGTGWKLLDFTGLALNPLFNTNAAQTPTSFGGAVFEGWVTGALQFDTGAVIPGDWTHVLFYMGHTLDYRYFTLADDNTPWLYEADQGRNYNGWKYMTTSVIAYQMPLWLRNVGVLVSTTTRLSHRDDSVMANHGWGSDFTEWVFGPLVFMEGGNHSLTVLVQWFTDEVYSEESGHFTTYRYEGTEVKPYRIALSYSYNW
jgi:hypothetical protein